MRGILVDRAHIERSPITRTRVEAVELARRIGEGVNIFSQEPLYKAFMRSGPTFASLQLPLLRSTDRPHHPGLCARSGDTEALNFVDKWEKPGLFTDDRTAEISCASPSSVLVLSSLALS